MNKVMLVRGYAEGEILIWFAVLGLLILALGSRWLVHKISFWMNHRKVLHLWPFK